MKLPTSTLFSIALITATTAVRASDDHKTPVIPSPIVEVSAGNLGGWVFSGEGAAAGTGSFVPGPGTAPLGKGSLELTLAGSSERLAVSTGAHAGTRLSALTAVGFSTFRPAAGAGLTLQLDMDYDLGDTTTSWQGTLVFDPALNGTVTPDAWQTWDALAGKWYMTANATAANASAGKPFPQSSPGTLAEILARFPNAGIRAVTGSVSLKAGGTGSVDADALTINATGADPKTYNFEPDSDGDGIPDAADKCTPSDIRPKVDVGMGATSIDNSVDANGCTIQDLVNQQIAIAKNHGKYVNAISKLGNDLKKAGTITNNQSKEMKTGAARSTIGNPSTSNSGSGSSNSGSGSSNSGSGSSNSGSGSSNSGSGSSNSGSGSGNSGSGSGNSGSGSNH